MWPGIAILAVIIAIYIGSYVLNKNTDAPEGLGRIDAVKCGACSNYGCAIKQKVAEEK